MKLLGPLGVTATEFGQVCASLADLCHDLVGTEVKKRKAEELPEEQRRLIERTGCVSGGGRAGRWATIRAVGRAGLRAVLDVVGRLNFAGALIYRRPSLPILALHFVPVQCCGGG
jgi:hypothetical protein